MTAMRGFVPACVQKHGNGESVLLLCFSVRGAGIISARRRIWLADNEETSVVRGRRSASRFGAGRGIADGQNAGVAGTVYVGRMLELSAGRLAARQVRPRATGAGGGSDCAE